MKKNKNINQSSFFFEDYLETNKKNKILKKANNFQDRIYLLFFIFLSLILIFSIKITLISLNEKNIFNPKKQGSYFSLLRRDIVDRNGIIISRNINTFHAAIDPKLVKDKKSFLVKLRLNFPNLSIEEIENKLNKKKYFRLKKRINQIEKDNLWALGEKAIKFEPFQARMYTHGNLFSHIIGQVDYDNYGISGV
jgi:cell division protein FtsI (penicillin-binding protein 3)